MYISTIDTMYHRLQTHLDTVYRYHTYEHHIPISTLYPCHTCRHTVTYTHVHPWTHLPTQAWVCKYTQVHTCPRHVPHTHTCTIDIHSTDTQFTSSYAPHPMSMCSLIVLPVSFHGDLGYQAMQTLYLEIYGP